MTPSTGLMRDIYATYVAAHRNDSSEELFDLWLFSIQAEAWAEGFADGHRQDAEGEDGPRFENPYTLTTEM